MKHHPPVLVIAGMHRSGTSLVASMAQRAGVRIGDRLLPANQGNPRGYFEDWDVVRIHDEMLRSRRQGVFVRNLADVGAPTTDEVMAAKQWARKRSTGEPWGFKDPRATLFLELWDEVLENPCYVFLYRRPIEVVLSLLRRAADLDVATDIKAAFDAWGTYNSALLDFYKLRPGRCLLVDTYNVTTDLIGFLKALENKLGLHWSEEAMKDLVFPNELHRARVAAEHQAVLHRLRPDVSELFGEIVAAADLSVPEEETPHDSRAQALNTLAAELLSDESVPENIETPILELLLALIDHQAVPRMRLAEMLDSVRANENGIVDLERHVLALQDNLDEKADWATRLDKENAEYRRQMTGLQADLNEKTAWCHELESLGTEKGRQLVALQEEFDKRTNWALELQGQLRDRDQRILRFQEMVDEINKPTPESDR